MLSKLTTVVVRDRRLFEIPGLSQAMDHVISSGLLTLSTHRSSSSKSNPIFRMAHNRDAAHSKYGHNQQLLDGPRAQCVKF